MPDRANVIKELESLRDICNAKSNMTIGNGKIAWAGYANAADDAIELLKKEQGSSEPMQLQYSKEKEEYWWYESICPSCDCHWITGDNKEQCFIDMGIDS